MRIAVAMSGGVDSSVAALLLARQGAEVVGLSMHLWNHGEGGVEKPADTGRCCTLDDLSTARRAAEAIGIPHYVLNLERRFREAVVVPFAESYLNGETPIPCLACNTEVKFKTLLERAQALSCEAVATGHYARVERENGAPRLLRAADLAKDQTYFLYDLTPAQLERAVFPLGAMTKAEVRRAAREAGLPNWDKPDSQEVCFVPARGGHAGFIRDEAAALGLDLPSFAGARAGAIAERDGRVVGRHEGTYAFTVGQRRGLGVATGAPMYVLEVDPSQARVVVGPKEALETRTVELSDVSLLISEPLARSRRVLARIRYRHPEQAALLKFEGEPRQRGGRGTLHFDEPVRAPAPGQSAVFFDLDRPEWVLGGGIIRRPESSS